MVESQRTLPGIEVEPRAHREHCLEAGLPNIEPAKSYSQTELARLLSVSERSIARWRMRGVHRPEGRIRLRAYRAGDRWRIRGRDAAEFLRSINPGGDREADTTLKPHTRRSGVDDLLDACGF